MWVYTRSYRVEAFKSKLANKFFETLYGSKYRLGTRLIYLTDTKFSDVISTASVIIVDSCRSYLRQRACHINLAHEGCEFLIIILLIYDPIVLSA